MKTKPIDLEIAVLADLGEFFKSRNIRPSQAACYLGFLIGYASGPTGDDTLPSFDANILENFQLNLKVGRAKAAMEAGDDMPTVGRA